MNDLDALKEFRQHLDEPDLSALARARARAVAGASSSGRRNPRRAVAWFVAPAAAAAVAAVALGIGLTATPAGPLRPAPTTTTLPNPSPTPTPTPPSVADLIEHLAVIAAAGPPAPDVTDQRIETTSTFQNEPGKWETQVYTTEPYGLIVSGNNEFGSLDSYRAYVRQQRDQLAAQGPSLKQPTPEWLATIDASPRNLRQLYAVALDCGSCTAPDAEWQIFNAVVDLNRLGAVMLPPPVRAGLLRLLGSLTNATAEYADVAGRPVLAIGFPHGGQLAEIFADAATGVIVGEGRTDLEQSADPQGCADAMRSLRASGSTARPTTPSACDRVPVPNPQRQVSTFFSTRLVPVR